MSAYFKDLPWKFDFSSVHNKVEEIANQRTIQGSAANPWCIVPAACITDSYPFSKIESEANKQGFSITHTIYRKQLKDGFTVIHTDSYNTGDGSLVTVPFSLNIPLENSAGATTRWYNFNDHPTLKGQETRFPVLDFKKFQSLTASDATNFLKYCIAEYTMKSPVIINTAIPHNVDSRNLVSNRSILSIWFVKKGTRTLATWDESKFLENITVD